MDDKRLPPSTNARRAGISNLVSGNLTPPNLTAPEQQTYAERGNNVLIQERRSTSNTGIHG